MRAVGAICARYVRRGKGGVPSIMARVRMRRIIGHRLRPTIMPLLVDYMHLCVGFWIFGIFVMQS